jgi:3,4-dihydroxy 2-butanone 4-phosphate synthase/GTP cyclohydrolase II
VDANLALGHPIDERDYSVAVLILQDLGVKSVRLLTNNPSKIQSLQEAGLPVVERVPTIPTVYSDNIGYLRTKVNRMNHLLNLSTRSTIDGTLVELPVEPKRDERD